jgi:RNA polymerase II subunit A small phosphatase-like protein
MASSKRSHQQQPTASEKVDQPPPVPTATQRDPSIKGKPKKSGGLLSCLPCFTPKEEHTTSEDIPLENAKQAGAIKPGRTTQATPVKKPDPTAESSTADSKEPIDEKAAGETYGDKMEKAQGDGTADSLSTDTPPKMMTRSSSKKQSADQPLPSLPNETGNLQVASPEINVQQPTPGTTPVQPRPSHEQQQIIQDRTDSQEEKDKDLEMKDVPISEDDVRKEGDEKSSDSAAEIPPKIDLPPPPPLEQRQNAVRDQTSESRSEAEAQPRYLLGPLRPEFMGKKCLVLDLDETLVHSSFKVS